MFHGELQNSLTMITIAIIHVISWVLAAICKAAMDTLQFHYYKSIFDRPEWPSTIEDLNHNIFWNPAMSWQNKYKYGIHENGPKFPGSTTIFVFLTDGWHLMQFFHNLFLALTIVTGLYIGSSEMIWWQYVVCFVLYRFTYSGIFELFFKRVLVK